MEESQSPSVPVPPKVSALILSYNDAAGLRRCLESLEAQTARKEMEIIVMDNGSSDGSATLDVDFPNATFLRLPRNFGSTKALNIGMRTAVGEYVFYLAPRMEVAADAIGKLAAVLDADADAAAACPVVVEENGEAAGDWWRLPDPATVRRLWRDPDAWPRITPALDGGPAAVEFVGIGALMVRKFFVKGLNYFDERYGDFGPDLELAFQIRRGRRKMLLIPAAHVTRHPAPALPAEAAGIIAADRLHGAARFLEKHYGFMTGMGLRIIAALGALVRFQVGLALSILSGSKIDGSQSEL